MTRASPHTLQSVVVSCISCGHVDFQVVCFRKVEVDLHRGCFSDAVKPAHVTALPGSSELMCYGELALGACHVPACTSIW
jgi:hypothetical protein